MVICVLGLKGSWVRQSLADRCRAARAEGAEAQLGRGVGRRRHARHRQARLLPRINREGCGGLRGPGGVRRKGRLGR